MRNSYNRRGVELKLHREIGLLSSSSSCVSHRGRERERLRFRRRDVSASPAEAALVSLDWFVHPPTNHSTQVRFDVDAASRPLQRVALLGRQLERAFSGWIRFSHHSFPLQTEIYFDFWFNSELQLQPFFSLSLRIEDKLRCVGAMSFKF